VRETDRIPNRPHHVMNKSSVSDTEEGLPSRYVVGIDLGTTNCAMAYVDSLADPWRIETFLIPQWTAWNTAERLETLPSFHYEWTPDERTAHADHLPWEQKPAPRCVGVLARDRGLVWPGRTIASAKSWLCHAGIDRTASVLPWHAEPDATRYSPVDASAAYLSHLRSAWDWQFPEFPLAGQDVVLTLPASFDEVARSLTIAAARQAGLPRVHLVEEPQAAFYAWLDQHRESWEGMVRPGEAILVCDIGGGTTDFTLIRVKPATHGVQFQRVAVGRHLILGGDNLDLALAHHLERRLDDQINLSPRQRQQLLRACRSAKEAMLSAKRPKTLALHLPAEGTRLIGGGLTVELDAEQADHVLIDGFFPNCALDVAVGTEQSGFQEFGLPYAADPAITHHLAEFLRQHLPPGAQADGMESDRPDIVLFNGGVMKSARLRQRIIDSLVDWYGGEDQWYPNVLAAERLDLAVSIGAAYYGMVRRGDGVKIQANLARTYYLQVAETEPQLLCLIPASAETGQVYRTSQPLTLRLGQPVQFPLWVSSTRLADQAGELIAIDPLQLSSLPPICTALVRGRSRKEATVEMHVEAELSEIGTLSLACVAPEGQGSRWQLEFDIRSTLITDRKAHEGQGEAAGVVDEETLLAARDVIVRGFPTPEQRTTMTSAPVAPSQVVRALSDATGLDRRAWPPTLLRGMWHTLWEQQAGRQQSPEHEARWLNLLGYCLRPGYGVAVDDWRVAQTWRTVYGQLAHRAPTSRTESLILWRRIAGGLSIGQQRQLADPLLAQLRGGRSKASPWSPHEAAEVWRLLASLELLDASQKQLLGDLASRLRQHKSGQSLHAALCWALGRLGARQLVYGPLNAVVEASVAQRWLEALMQDEHRADKAVQLAVLQLARLTGDRYRDLPASIRERAIAWLRAGQAPQHAIDLVERGGQLASEEEGQIFGEALPLGLRLSR